MARQFRLFLYNGYVQEHKQERKTYNCKADRMANACSFVRGRARKDFKAIGPNGITISQVSERLPTGEWVRLCVSCGKQD